MSGLSAADKIYLEKVLGMAGGYVLNFTDAAFGQFFHRYNVDIHGIQYQFYGTSKAKKLRVFWGKESDALVAEVLSEMLDTYEALCDSAGHERDTASLAKSREIVGRLSGTPPQANYMTEEWFLKEEFDIPSIHKLPVEFAVSEIIQERLHEAQAVSVCGSILVRNFPMW